MEYLGPLTKLIDWLMKLKERSKSKNSDLHFEGIEAFHWYKDEDDPMNQRSGIHLKMYIINKGNKPTALREFEIVSMDPDYLDTIYKIRINHTEIGIGKEIPYSDTYFFHTSDFRMDKIEFVLEITHTDGTETLPMTSFLTPTLKRVRVQQDVGRNEFSSINGS